MSSNTIIPGALSTKKTLTRNGYKFEYDEFGFLVKTTYPDGLVELREFDECGNETYMEDSAGFKQWKEYNSKGYLIRVYDIDGKDVTLETPN